MLSDEKLKNIANIKLQIAVVNGEKWAIEAALGISQGINLTLNGGEDKLKWDVEIHHVGAKPNTGDTDGEKEEEKSQSHELPHKQEN